MPLGKRHRKLILVLCFGLVAIFLLGLSLPLWYPWELRPLAAKYGVRAYPTTLFIDENGKTQVTISEFMPPAEYRQKLEQAPDDG